ncbi:MAG TPA: HIT family protein [Candidatus Nanoarchaeia archaeon]|nr:HIT family protein [Candidatus Nanoarchaeia archaeon]
MEDCIFCKIIEGKIPSAKIYEDGKVICFLDIMPANKGHCLVIPKNHSKDLSDMKDEDAEAAIKAARKVAKALSLSLGCQGFNLVMSNGLEAGQVVFHSHIHIVPRFKNDGLKIKWPHTKYKDGEMKEYADKIKKFL